MVWRAQRGRGQDEPRASRRRRSPAERPTDERPQQKTGSVKGFDPYNSGAFEKRNAWEKVSKR
jgi:hypothetical protein